jgi:hypothetical protein
MGKQRAAAEKYVAPEPEDTPDASLKVGEDIDAQIRRLRQILTLMAPETGSVALGSSRRPTSHVPITERVRLLTEYRR